MNRVEGKVVIVTGGSHGIGKSACKMLAQEGAKVAVTDVKDHDGKDVAEAIQNDGGTAEYWHLDVSQEAEVKTVFSADQRKVGQD